MNIILWGALLLILGACIVRATWRRNRRRQEFLKRHKVDWASWATELRNEWKDPPDLTPKYSKLEMQKILEDTPGIAELGEACRPDTIDLREITEDEIRDFADAVNERKRRES